MHRVQFNQMMYDGYSVSFKKFKKRFLNDAKIFGWDSTKQAKMIQYCLIDIAKDIWEALSVEERLDIDKIFNSLEQECVRSYNHYFKNQSASRPVDNQMPEVQSLVQSRC